MANVNIKFNGKDYLLSCDDGQEESLKKLTLFLDKKYLELKEKLGITIFMISHDLFTVMKNSDQVICLNGHLCCSGKPTDLDTNSDFKNALSEIGVYVHNHDHNH